MKIEILKFWNFPRTATYQNRSSCECIRLQGTIVRQQQSTALEQRLGHCTISWDVTACHLLGYLAIYVLKPVDKADQRDAKQKTKFSFFEISFFKKMNFENQNFEFRLSRFFVFRSERPLQTKICGRNFWFRKQI